VAVIRPYKPGDEHGICRLFSAVFQIEAPLEVWQWKYLRAGTLPLAYVAEEDGEILCHAGGIRQRLMWGGVEGWGFNVVDVMAHPSRQGQGLFRRTLEAGIAAFADGQILFGYGFPTRRHRRLGELVAGYEPIGRVHRLRKVGILVAPGSRDHNLAFDVVPFDWDTHWRRLSSRFGVVNHRDREYLLWRYWTHPRSRYRFVTIQGAPALAVVGITGGKARLMEFLVEPENDAAARTLLAGVEAVVQDERATVIEGWFPSFAWESRFLQDFGGFTSGEGEIWLECRIFDERLRAAWLADNFYYSLGDFDAS
jgi:hypothetical protein